ncbi:hypothetical protein GQ457_04G006190 [Hibiscus cannabinus]
MTLTWVGLLILFFMFFSCCLQTSCFLGLNNSVLKTPAVYAFGDSAIDAGNNKFIPNATARFNFMPYGIDFLGGIPTGRTTNGKTVVDFIAESVGLPFTPPMLSLSKAQHKSTRTGVNFGSSSSGIQPMPPKTKKIFVRTNDLGIYWELDQKRSYHDVEKYSRYKTYGLGARKFVVNNISPLGCRPAYIHRVSHNTSCVEDVNRRVATFNDLLPNMLMELETSLKGSTFILCDLYKLFEEVHAQPETYGFTNVVDSCCIDVNGNQTRECAPGRIPCSDRETHAFFDPFHPSQSMHKLWFQRCVKDII